MKTISRQKLFSILKEQETACPITITTLTDARAKKTNNPYGMILKLNRVNGFTGFEYENSVNRQRVREGKEADFEVKERAWGERINRCLVSNNGEHYLAIKVQKELMEPVYMYIAGGFRIIGKTLISKFLPKDKVNGNQGLDKAVEYKNYKLSSIIKISINGETYKIR